MKSQLSLALAAMATMLPASGQDTFSWIVREPNSQAVLDIADAPDGATIRLALTGEQEPTQLRKFDANGDIEWTTETSFPGPFSFSRFFMDVDEAGRTAVAFRLQSGSRLRMFDADGQMFLDRPLIDPNSGGFPLQLNDIRFAPNGELYLLTTYVNDVTLRRFAPDGAELAPITVAGASTIARNGKLDIDDAGKIYFAAKEVPGNFRLYRFLPDGTPDGDHSIPASDGSNISALEVDSGGNMYVATDRGPQGRTNLQQITPAMQLGWRTNWTRPNNLNTEVYGMLANANGELVVYGVWARLAHFRKYDTEGNQVDQSPLVNNGFMTNAVTAEDGSIRVLGWRAAPNTQTGPDSKPVLSTIPLQGPSTTAILDTGVFPRQELQASTLDSRGNLIFAVEGTFSGAPGEQDMLWKLPLATLAATELCNPAETNSTGAPATLEALGSSVASTDNVTLLASATPPGTTVLFLASMTTGFTPNAGGSQGNLCLAGAIGRYLRPGELRTSSAAGDASVQIPLSETPQPTSSVPVLAGQSWAFQAWYRDANPTATSNFTSAIVVDFN